MYKYLEPLKDFIAKSAELSSESENYEILSTIIHRGIEGHLHEPEEIVGTYGEGIIDDLLELERCMFPYILGGDDNV